MFTFVYSLGCTGDTLCDLLLLGVNQIDDEFPSITGWQVRFVPVQKSALSGLEHSTFERIVYPGNNLPGVQCCRTANRGRTELGQLPSF